MSVETLVLVALFIILPLIERLLRSRRQPEHDAADVPRPRPRPSVPPLPPQPPPPMDARAPRTADVPRVAASPAERRLPNPGLPPPGARRTGRRRLVEDLRHPLTLRRAVLLMTILGPCRSVAPHDWEAPS